MQWPVVFVRVRKNRFPSRGSPAEHRVAPSPCRGRSKTRPGIEGTIEDERRLFYVAMTRSQKFLHFTYAPIAGNRLHQNESTEFWNDVLVSKCVKHGSPTTPPDVAPARPEAACRQPRFLVLRPGSRFECPYQFKFRDLYGFNAPIHEALGYGHSLHDALAEVHAKAVQGDYANETRPTVSSRRTCIRRTPTPSSRKRSRPPRTTRHHATTCRQPCGVRQPRVLRKANRLGLETASRVVGRIDLVRRLDTNETTIVNLKSNDRAQPEEVTKPSSTSTRRVRGAHRETARLRRNIRAGRTKEEAPIRGRATSSKNEVKVRVNDAARGPTRG